MFIYWLVLLGGVVAHDNGVKITPAVVVAFIILGFLKVVVTVTEATKKALK